MERKKLAWRAAGAGKWTGYEGVVGSGQQGNGRDMKAWRRSVVKRRGAVVYEMNGYEKMRWAAAQQKKGGAIYL